MCQQVTREMKLEMQAAAEKDNEESQLKQKRQRKKDQNRIIEN